MDKGRVLPSFGCTASLVISASGVVHLCGPRSGPTLAGGARLPAMRCVICADPKKRDFVARRQLEGHSANAMEGLSRASGLPIKRETISKHLKVCLGTPEGVTPKQVAAVAERTKPPAYAPAEDVATLVQREVIAKLQDGTARVTVQHGLQAQQLIDRRAERAKDRELAVTLARLLHSGMPPVAMVQERTIIDVTPD